MSTGAAGWTDDVSVAQVAIPRTMNKVLIPRSSKFSKAFRLMALARLMASSVRSWNVEPESENSLRNRICFPGTDDSSRASSPGSASVRFRVPTFKSR